MYMEYANPFTELQFESSSLQNSYQKPMVNPIEGLGLILIDQCGFGAIYSLWWNVHMTHGISLQSQFSDTYYALMVIKCNIVFFCSIIEGLKIFIMLNILWYYQHIPTSFSSWIILSVVLWNTLTPLVTPNGTHLNW